MFVGIIKILTSEEMRVGGDFLRKNRYVGLLIKATKVLMLIKVLMM